MDLETGLAIAFFLSISLASGSPQYQFSSFSGPVSGSSKEAPVPRVAAHFDHKRPLGALKEHDPTMQFGAALDYVARPDYTFAYGVQDPLSGNVQSHQEQRDGDVVHGRYRVLESDGSVRTVTYTADPEKGFQSLLTELHYHVPVGNAYVSAADWPAQGFSGVVHKADVHRTPPDPAAAPPEHYEAEPVPAQEESEPSGYQPGDYNE